MSQTMAEAREHMSRSLVLAEEYDELSDALNAKELEMMEQYVDHAPCAHNMVHETLTPEEKEEIRAFREKRNRILDNVKLKVEMTMSKLELYQERHEAGLPANPS